MNETAVREGRITNPLGKKFVYHGMEGTIIGVAKDFHFAPLREKIQPFVFYYRPDNRKMFAGWAMSQWLQDFAYRTPLTWWIFAAAAAGALLITLLTVSVQAVRAALVNPIRALRTE